MISLNDLSGKGRVNIELVLIELFMKRPYLANPHEDTQLVECLQKIEDFYLENSKCKPHTR